MGGGDFSEVAKERIWKEHLRKLDVMRERQFTDGSPGAKFTVNPFHMLKHKPLAEGINKRPRRFLDKEQAALDAVMKQLSQKRTYEIPEEVQQELDAMSGVGGAKLKNRNYASNDIFGSAAEAKRKQHEEASVQHSIMGGGGTGGSPTKATTATTTKASSQAQKGASSSATTQLPPIHQKSGGGEGDGGEGDDMRKLFAQVNQPPVAKYKTPATTQQELGWDQYNTAPQFKRLMQRDAMFTHGLKSCEITKFANHAAGFK